MRLRHWKTRLSTDHSRTTPSRFSNASVANPSHRMLYLGENHQVVLYEVEALYGPMTAVVSNPAGSWILMSLEVSLNIIVNLTMPAEQNIIKTSNQELTGVWNSSANAAPTQRLGEALYGLPGIEGALFPSSKPGGGSNLVIFPDKLEIGSNIRFYNELIAKSESIR